VVVGRWIARAGRGVRRPGRAPDLELRVCGERRRAGRGPRLIAGTTRVAHSTVHAILVCHGPSRAPTQRRGEVCRYEWPCPGDLVHVDVKQYPRFRRPGHAVTGDRRAQKLTRVRPLGHDHFHATVDDHSRLAEARMGQARPLQAQQRPQPRTATPDLLQQRAQTPLSPRRPTPINRAHNLPGRTTSGMRGGSERPPSRRPDASSSSSTEVSARRSGSRKPAQFGCKPAALAGHVRGRRRCLKSKGRHPRLPALPISEGVRQDVHPRNRP